MKDNYTLCYLGSDVDGAHFDFVQSIFTFIFTLEKECSPIYIKLMNMDTDIADGNIIFHKITLNLCQRSYH